jgi:hypothetical protein
LALALAAKLGSFQFEASSWFIRSLEAGFTVHPDLKRSGLINFAVAYFERFCLRNKVRLSSDNPRINVSDPKTTTKKESRFNPCWPVMYTTVPPTIDRTANMKTAHFSLSISPILIIEPHQSAARRVVDTLRIPK